MRVLPREMRGLLGEQPDRALSSVLGGIGMRSTRQACRVSMCYCMICVNLWHQCSLLCSDRQRCSIFDEKVISTDCQLTRCLPQL